MGSAQIGASTALPSFPKVLQLPRLDCGHECCLHAHLVLANTPVQLADYHHHIHWLIHSIISSYIHVLASLLQFSSVFYQSSTAFTFEFHVTIAPRSSASFRPSFNFDPSATHEQNIPVRTGQSSVDQPTLRTIITLHSRAHDNHASQPLPLLSPGPVSSTAGRSGRARLFLIQPNTYSAIFYNYDNHPPL